MQASSSTTPVDPFTEVMFCKDSEEFPFTDFTQLQFRGPMDTQAMQSAWSQAIDLVPLFSSRLIVTRRGLFQIPAWQHHPGQNPLSVEDCRQAAPDPFDPMVFSMAHHRERMDRRIDLFSEFPFQGHLLRVGPDRWILSIVYQHSVVDPYKVYRVMTRMLAEYHELTMGQPPEWADSLGMASLARRGKDLWEPTRTTMLTFPSQAFWTTVRQTGWKRHEKRIQIAAIASRRDDDPASVRGRHGLRAVIDDFALIQALLARSKRARVTLNDMLLTAAQTSIHQWNAHRGADRDWFKMVLATSLKGRTEIAERVGTGLSALSFILRGDSSSDVDTRMAHVRAYRKEMLDRKFDVKAYAWASDWYSLLRVLPFHLRHKRLAKLLGGGTTTFNLSNVGVVWPKFVDGKPTLDSAVLGTGELVIEDLHSCPTFGAKTSLGLVTRMHNRKLYLNFVCNRCQFDEDEAQGLVDAYVKTLKNLA